jgi:hypothetical protein
MIANGMALGRRVTSACRCPLRADMVPKPRDIAKMIAIAVSRADLMLSLLQDDLSKPQSPPR